MPVHDWTRVDAGIFHAFHHWWIAEISGVLNAGVLPKDYYALPEQDAGPVGPDVLTLQAVLGHSRHASPSAETGEGPRHGTALADSPPRVRFTHTLAEAKPRRRPRSVVIRHVSDHRIVALIEVVSPGNKASRNEIRSFVEKAMTILRRGIHLMIFDLFPPGPRDPHGIPGAIKTAFGEHPFEVPDRQPLMMASYAAGSPTRAFVEAVAVGDMLPDMPLFLLPDWYVDVPLERSYAQAWQHFPEPWRQVLDEDNPG